jgi:hypothetical protein
LETPKKSHFQFKNIRRKRQEKKWHNHKMAAAGNLWKIGI